MSALRSEGNLGTMPKRSALSVVAGHEETSTEIDWVAKSGRSDLCDATRWYAGLGACPTKGAIDILYYCSYSK